MNNVIAIAEKELRAYFASPIAWVMVGLFSLLVGGFFLAGLDYFVRLSAQMDSFAQMGQDQPTINVNQHLIRPLLSNVCVIALFVLPMVTMRTYAEEKRSGTIELLLTAPLTDWQIILGKFFGAVALYAVMLIVSLIHIGILFIFGEPEWPSVLTGYLGLLLMGSAFLSLGLFISSMTKNQIIAVMATFASLLLLWIVSWFADAAGPTTQAVLRHLSIIEHFDNFSKGVLDTTDLVYYLSFIALGLFLTAKSVDLERWRG